MQATNAGVPTAPDGVLGGRAPVVLVLLVCLPAPLHFFESFPNGWDQAEYVWCVKDGFLPHSPYVLFVLLGRALALFLPPAVALSALSLVSGVAAVGLLYQLVSKLSGDPPRAGRRAALGAALLLGTSTVFVRHAATQEVYALQLCLVLASAVFIVSALRRRLQLSGLAYGCALAAHNASVFVLPALLVLVVARAGDTRRLRVAAAWLAAAALPLAAVYAFTGMVLPTGDDPWLSSVFGYLRGMPPSLDFGALVQPGELVRSARGIAARLIDGEIAVTRGPLATGPVGVSAFWFAAAIVGFAVLVRGRRASVEAWFWALFPLPFLLYELALGWNLDYGTYLVFVMPPLCACSARAAEWLAQLPRRFGTLREVGMLAALAVPSLLQIAQHWGDVEVDRRRHDSPATLAAVFAASALPGDAVVIQPRSEWNANLLPLHSERRHVARVGTTLRLLRSREPWTPMNPGAYELLTTERLAELVRAGHPVIAFEPRPLQAANPGHLDEGQFEWRPFEEVDLSSAAAMLGLTGERASRFQGRTTPMYRAQLVMEPGA